jgi:rsbT co-antagonist protein RsbR
MTPLEQLVLPALLKTHEKQILADDWMARQKESLTSRRDLMSDSELERQSREFLTAFVKAAEAGGAFDVRGPSWQPVREVLGRISQSRSTQGFSPSETATFVFSLKQPVFAHLRNSVSDVEVLARETWALRSRSTHLVCSRPRLTRNCAKRPSAGSSRRCSSCRRQW